MSRNYFSRVAICMLVAAAPASAAFAQSPPTPQQQSNSSALWFENWGSLSHATLKIVTPAGKVLRVYAETGTPVFQLQGQTVGDGVYRYDLTAATAETRPVDSEVNNGREIRRRPPKRYRST